MPLDSQGGADAVALSSSACDRFPFLALLANNAVISSSEIHMLERFALGHRKADFVEKQVLQTIFRRVDQFELASQLNGDMARFRETYGV